MSEPKRIKFTDAPEASKDTTDAPEASKDTTDAPEASKDTTDAPEASKATTDAPEASKDTICAPEASKATTVSVSTNTERCIESPVDLLLIQPWTSWTDAFKCKICSNGYSSISYEIHYQMLGKDNIIITEACTLCARALIERDPEMMTQKYWSTRYDLFDKYYELGLVGPVWMEKHGLIPPTPDDSQRQ